MIYPPTDARPGAEVYQQAEARAPGEGLRVVLEGEDFDTLQVVTQTVLLPIGEEGSGEERLASSGVTLREEPDGRLLVDLVEFGSDAESLGIQWDFEVKAILVDNDVPPTPADVDPGLPGAWRDRAAAAPSPGTRRRPYR